MKISKEEVIKIMKYLDENDDFYFPFKIFCEDLKDDNEYYEKNFLEENDYEFIKNCNEFKNFYLVENLQNLYPQTVELMAKGFLDKIEHHNILNKISSLAKKSRKDWDINLCESVCIEEYGLNEYLGGKADAYEDCEEILKKHLLPYELLSNDKYK